MSSTNKTSNYELSQFIGTDKPAWLADYNSDMSKIDAQMKNNADAATTAGGAASTANTSIGTLANLTTEAKTDLVSAINEVDSHADTAQSTANTANTTATALASFVNINTYTTLTASITTGTGNITSNAVSCAYNSDKSLAKVYGEIKLNFTSANGGIITIPSSLAPSTNITINGGLIFTLFNNNGQVIDSGNMSYTIKTNGDIEITETNSSYWGTNAGIIKLSFINSVLFIKDFGDTPIPV